MPYTAVEIAEYGRKLGRSRSTLFKWISEGCNLRDDKSVREWVTRNTIRETNISKARKRRHQEQTKSVPAPECHKRPPAASEPPGNGELPPAGKHGAAHTLTRLEHEEQESFRRLQSALASGDRLAIDACQTYWLKVAETLRRLDVSIEINRRQEEVQIPLKTAQETVTFVVEWLRIAIAQFLSAETGSLMAIRAVPHGLPDLSAGPVYRMQFAPQINNGWRTSVCARCLSAPVESLKRPGLRDRFRSPKPCEVCARPVYNLKRWTITRVICSPRCHGIIDTERTKQNRSSRSLGFLA